MKTMFTALIIPARTAEPVRVEPIEATLKNLQELVEGDIESITRGDWHVYLNAEGMIRNLPLNLRAAQLTYDRGLDLAGAARGCAVFLGNDEHRGETEVPELWSGEPRNYLGCHWPPNRASGVCLQLPVASHQPGLMFWLSRKKFVGSYWRLRALSLSYLAAPYACLTRSSPSSMRKFT
jgi:hypothetical protein